MEAFGGCHQRQGTGGNWGVMDWARMLQWRSGSEKGNWQLASRREGGLLGENWLFVPTGGQAQLPSIVIAQCTLFIYN